MHNALRRNARLRGTTIALCLTAAGFFGTAHADDTKSIPEQTVDTFTALAGGPHAGYRANHAKGIVARGVFVPSKAGRTLTKAAFVKGPAVPVTIRFSNGTGVPTLPDAHAFASPHGMAIRFHLPGGVQSDIVAISFNGFPVSTPEDLLGLLQSIAKSGPDAPKPSPIEQFLGSHPAALAFVTTPKPAPVGYGTLSFYGVNAFQFTNGAGVVRHGRYQILPVAGDQRLTDEAAAAKAPDYLRDELETRLAKGAVKFRILVQIAKDGDPTDDPTKAWPDDRETVELGILSVDTLAPDNATAQKSLAFNPLLLVDGIAPSADPILLARPGAYAISVSRRLP